jgi:DNA-binding IclR family transcriptional regulator
MTLALPPGAVSPAKTRVFVAVLAGAHSIDAAAEATGLTKSNVYEHLMRLRRLGLVDWEPHRKGTLRALVRPVEP